jgi:NAD+ kinase
VTARAPAPRKSAARGSARGRGPRVLVVYKKSAYQLYVHERKNERVKALLARDHVVVARLRDAHDDHVGALADAERILRDLGARAVFRYRADAGTAEDVDLVVTLGGDGTLLWASHEVGPGVPIVAINTAPRDSVGFFCAGTKDHLGDVLADALAGRLRATELARMKVVVDGVTMSERVLNDALYCHESPAATSRYLLLLDGEVEEQKSSGLWIGPAAGSTAAQRSAGGKVLPPTSTALQYVVREPYTPDGAGYAHTRGLVRDGERLRVVSKMRAGRLYLDGPHDAHVVEMGAEIAFTRSPQSLTLLGFRRR